MLPVRAAIKSLRRSPGFATVSIFSLALALGLVAAVFGLVDAIRHPRTATFEPDRLFAVSMKGAGAAGTVTLADHIDVLERFVRSAQDIAYTSFALGTDLRANDARITANGSRVSANYFGVRGVRPMAGRLFSEATADEDAVSSVLISERIWRSAFDAEPRLERLAVTIESETETRRMQVIGVVPQELRVDDQASYWLALPRDVRAFAATARFMMPMVRLRPGATIDSLNAEFQKATEYLTNLHGKGRVEFVYTARPMMTDPLRIDEFVWLLVGAAIGVLLIACANLANLVLARGVARQHDMAVRLSLGARRSDMVKDVLAECLVIALGGAALGIVASAWGFAVLRANMPESIPTGAFVVAMNWRVVAMSSGAAVGSALLFGLLPALRLSDLRLAEHIKENSGTTTSRRRNRFPALVIGQVALSLAMLTGVSLLLRASQQIRALDYGFDPSRILTVQLNVRSRQDTSEASRLALWAAAETRLRANPGVEAVAWSSGVGLSRGPTLTAERSGGAFRTRYLQSYTYASPGLLRTVGVTVIRGRDFEDHDAFGASVVIIDSATALKTWGSEDPIGKLVKFAPEDRIAPWFRVVGISRPIRSDVPRHDGEEIAPQVWLAGKTAFTPTAGTGMMPLHASIPWRSFVVRAKTTDVAVLRTEIPRTMRDIMPRRGSTFVYGWDDSRRALLAQQRMLSRVFGAFGVLSLALCALGLYSVLSYAVTQRMREHGIRVALGASSRHIFLDVLHEGAILVIAGTAVGGFATIWTNRLVDPYIGMLYYIDAIALVAAETVLVAVALASMVRPALRATRTDPVEVLRAG